MFDDNSQRVQIDESPILAAIVSPVVLCEKGQKAFESNSPQLVKYDRIMVYKCMKVYMIRFMGNCLVLYRIAQLQLNV